MDLSSSLFSRFLRGLNISIHRHYTTMALDRFEIAFGIRCIKTKNGELFNQNSPLFRCRDFQLQA